ncbi:ubiquitin carboxyl-terminal hydrolase 27 [Tripterygium wilfordii]|uniref:Ubiquitin carboxyl-terminal hydrolase n=1 Tax=Tripterygium wilfordii TaxID=458696 RepID=A0A7J7DFX5_TRIWF|nr:ubiquitin carboxyl-terminal hydrolase 27 [Tripterygium wilfordii]KAF5745178.1 ubiquitin carboxyl-terminal hydrolase 27 [Tripterygium wilfordii]
MMRSVSLTRNIKHGYGALSYLKGVSASPLHVSAVGLLGAAGLILVFTRDRLLGKLSSISRLTDGGNRSEKYYLVPGLQNLGNNCFLNVILQALASCSCLSTYLGKVMEASESWQMGDAGDSMALTVALAALLEELSEVCEGRVVLNPREVMLAMTLYIQNFNLTSQQDAAEAFLHLLSSLREEFSDCYPSNHSLLADAVTSVNCRVLSAKRIDNRNEQERWQQHFLGPFDGILGSILTCQSCSSQISLDYQFFHSLPLSPVLDSGATIMVGSPLEDCLKKFTAAEKVENYRCNRCWHIAAIRYLSVLGATEADIERLRMCDDQDSCNCQRIPHIEKLPWSNNIPCTIKQLFIARFPKILCIHLQRAAVNMFGEPVKLQGHIAFPLVLDLSRFITSGVGTKNWEELVPTKLANQQYQKPRGYPLFLNMQQNTRLPNSLHELTEETTSSVVAAPEQVKCTTHFEGFPGRGNMANMVQLEGCSGTTFTNADMQFDDKVRVTSQSGPSENHMYNLVSVVEHFGRPGGGHYTVYRRAKTGAQKEVPDKGCLWRWFRVSDSEVYDASEEDVLDCEASILFYERIMEN